MNKIQKFLDRAVVVAKALPTYLVLVSTIITVFNKQIAGILPDGVSTTLGQWVVVITGAIASAVVIIRNVTPVLEKADKGLLPPGS